jgi:hypothetical protein
MCVDDDDEEEETVDHITSGCPTLTKNEYII